MRRLALGFALGGSIAAAACVSTQRPRAVAPPPLDGTGAPGTNPIAVAVAEDRPTLAYVPREGDPAGAVALVVTTDSLAEADGLLAVVSSRVADLGLVTDGVASRAGFRVTILVPSPEAARHAITRLGEALRSPVTGDPTGLLAARAAALEKGPRADAAEEAVVDCALEPVLFAKEHPLPLAELEPARRRAFVRARVGFGVVGTLALVRSASEALAAGPPWPSGAPVAHPASAATEPSVLVGLGARPRVRVAARVARRLDAFALAHGLSSRPGISEIRAVLHPEGACVLVEAEASGRDELTDLVVSLRRGLAATPSSAETARVARRLRAVGDPRELAASAATFAVARDGGFPTTLHATVALGRQASDSQVSALRAALKSAWSHPDAPAIARSTILTEPGRGELMALVASRCPVVEGPSEAGLSVVVATALARADADGVELTPWTAPDGAGLLGRTLPRDGESLDETAARLGRVLGLSFFGAPPDAGAIASVRARLLSEADPGRDPLVEELGGAGASQLAPWGTFEGLGRVTDASAKGRWSTWMAGPLGLAAIVEVGSQGVELERTLARFSPRGAAVAACPIVPPLQLAPGARTVSSRSSPPRVFLALPVEGPAASVSALVELAGEHLADALGPAMRASFRREGPLVVVEIRGPEDRLAAAAARVREHLVAVAQRDPSGAKRVATRLRLERRLDPRARLIDAFRGRAPEAALTDEGLVTWLRETVRDERFIVVTATSTGR